MTNKTIDINEFLIQKYVELLRPEDLEIRKQIDIKYTYDKKVVILFEVRPDWIDEKKIQHFEFAKMRYYKSRKEWNLYWMQSNGKWKIYEPFPKSTHLEKLIKIIKKDEYACFFG